MLDETDISPEFPLRVSAGFAEEFPDGSASATECAMNLVRTATVLLAEFDRHRRRVANLSAAASQVLAIIEGAGEPLPPHVIASRLLVTSGTLTTVLDTLQRHGYIVRVPHPDDRRKLLIDLTDSARAIVDAMLPRIHAAEREAFTSLSEQERALLVELLGRVQRRLAELDAVPPPETLSRRIKSSAG